VSKSLENALIEISDSGCGIAAHLQEKVFEPDYTSKPGVGTGLGLAIIKHICSQRNGSVKLVSQPSIGTQVQIRLPIFHGGPDAT
jgi:signal transduction histidine kinase